MSKATNDDADFPGNAQFQTIKNNWLIRKNQLVLLNVQIVATDVQYHNAPRSFDVSSSKEIQFPASQQPGESRSNYQIPLTSLAMTEQDIIWCPHQIPDWSSSTRNTRTVALWLFVLPKLEYP